MKYIRLDDVDYPVKHYPVTVGRYAVAMTDPKTGAVIAYLSWHEFTGEIRQVRVEAEVMRRRGIATALLQIARSISSVPIVHSESRSDDGDAWARAVALPGEELTKVVSL